MSTLIGKDSLTDNVIHMTSDTRTVSELQSGPMASTVFHSKRPYLTVNKVAVFTPDFSTAVDLYQLIAYPVTSIKYTSTTVVDTTKPIIIVSELATQYYGTVYTLSSVSPHNVNSLSSAGDSAFKYFLTNINTSGNEIECQSGQTNSTRAITTSGTNSELIPVRLHVIELVNEITNYDATKLTGDIEISSTNGIRVGNTNFFDKSYMAFFNTVNSTLSASGGVFNEMCIRSDVNANGIAQFKSLQLSAPLPGAVFDISLDSTTISSNGYTLVAPSFSYLRKTAIITLDNVDPDIDSRFSVVSKSSYTIGPYTGNVATAFDLSSLNLTDSSYVIVHLQFHLLNSSDTNPRYKIISGLLSYNGHYNFYMDGGTGIAHACNYLTKTTTGGTYALVYDFNDAYYDGTVWQANGNISQLDNGTFPYIVGVSGWVAKVESIGLT